MTRGLAVLGSAVFFLIAPTTVAGVVPWWISRWRLQAPFFDLQLIRWFGVVLILLGIPVLVETFTRFALQGGGTLVLTYNNNQGGSSADTGIPNAVLAGQYGPAAAGSAPGLSFGETLVFVMAALANSTWYLAYLGTQAALA